MRAALIAFLFLAGLVTLPPLPLPAAPAPPFKPDAKEIDAIVAEAMKAFGVPGCAVAIVKDDEAIHLKGYGVRQNGKQLAVTPDTLFPIASTSKAFTATGLAMLADEGKLKWDDPVRKHVEYFHLEDPLADDTVTLRDLICHRTGLSRNDLLWYKSPWTRKEIIRRVAKVKLTKPFREMFQYQNIMYAAAGEAIGRQSGTHWEDFIALRFFTPLGMKTANCSTIESEKAADHARPHLVRANGQTHSLESWLNLENCAPAGGINSSVRDLVPWIRFNLGDGTFNGKRLLAAKSLKELHSPQMVVDMDGPTGVPSLSREANPETNVTNYGLGWIIQDYRGEHIVWHGGSVDGFRSNIALVPKHKLGIAILSNLGKNSMAEALRNSLIDYLVGLERKGWNAHFLAWSKKQAAKQEELWDEQDKNRAKGTKPSLALEAYAGNYDEPAYDRATLSVEDKTLVLKWSTFTVRLEHWHYDTFRVHDPKSVDRDHPLYRQTLTFVLDAAGKPSKLRFLEQEFGRATQ